MLGVKVRKRAIAGLANAARRANGVDDVGFGARPGGLRAKDGTFYNAGLTGMWWTSTVNLSKMSWYREVNFFSGRLYRTFNYREDAFSVRCLKVPSKKQAPPQPWNGDN